MDPQPRTNNTNTTGSPMDAISALYPIHWLVSVNKPDLLCEVLEKKEHNLETRDPRGRTALDLAVWMGRIECVQLLLAFGASPLARSRSGWSLVSDGITNCENRSGVGESGILKMLIEAEQVEMRNNAKKTIIEQLELLGERRDFSFNMKWKYIHQVTGCEDLLPEVLFRIEKQGNCLAVYVNDTTFVFSFSPKVVGEENNTNTADDNGSAHPKVFKPNFFMLEHKTKKAYSLFGEFESVNVTNAGEAESAGGNIREVGSVLRQSGLLLRYPAEKLVQLPVVMTEIDSSCVGFERMRRGAIGWLLEEDQTREFDGVFNNSSAVLRAKAFDVVGLALSSRIRFEHLPLTVKEFIVEDAKQEFGSESGGGMLGALWSSLSLGSSDSGSISEKEKLEIIKPIIHADTEENRAIYFDPRHPCESIGREMSCMEWRKKAKSNLFMLADFPFSMYSDLLPICEILQILFPQFHKVNLFANIGLPPGFPVRLDIPVYHSVNASIQFSDFKFAKEIGEPLVPRGDLFPESLKEFTYCTGSGTHGVLSLSAVDDDPILQALFERHPRVCDADAVMEYDEEFALAQAVNASLSTAAQGSSAGTGSRTGAMNQESDYDAALQKALALSLEENVASGAGAEAMNTSAGDGVAQGGAESGGGGRMVGGGGDAAGGRDAGGENNNSADEDAILKQVLERSLAEQ